MKEIYKKRVVSGKFFNSADGFQRFCDINLANLNNYALYKIEYVWGNQMSWWKTIQSIYGKN